MLAKPADKLPSDDGWLFEPKWDGFRAIVFRDGDEVYTQSRDLKPLDRYFPELVDPLRAALPDRCILDGEVVISKNGELDFEALLLRIHPAASRVKMLAAESPASFVAWDLLALGDDDLRDTPQGERRALLEGVARERATARPPHAGDDRSGVGRRLVPPLRGGRPRWRDRETAGRQVPAGEASDAEDQAPAHGRLRCGRLPLAQERAGDTRRVAAAGALRRRGIPAPRRSHVVLHMGQARRARPGAGAAAQGRAPRPPMGRVGGRGRRRAPPTPRASGCPARHRAGTGARTCRGSRSARSVSSRSRTTIFRVIASGTGRRSSAGARTSRPPSAVTTSSRKPQPTRSPRSSAPEARRSRVRPGALQGR